MSSALLVNGGATSGAQAFGEVAAAHSTSPLSRAALTIPAIHRQLCWRLSRWRHRYGLRRPGAFDRIGSGLPGRRGDRRLPTQSFLRARRRKRSHLTSVGVQLSL
jgi:hypothetical protein